MLISVIVPVYNVEKYLDRCFQSIVEQTYKEIEIILIDDGSTDASGKMCDGYKEKDDRVIVIHKENGGLSSARNVGLDIAKGEYLTFVDSDDYLDKDFIRHAFFLCQMHHTEISILNMAFIKEDFNAVLPKHKYEFTYFMTSEDAIKESLYQKKFSCCAPGKLYKKELFRNIRFPLNKIAEDLAVCHLIFNQACCIIYSNEYGYYYRQQDNSIMHTFNEKRLEVLEWTHEIERFCRNYYPNLKKAALCRSFNCAIHLVLDLPDDADNYEKYYQIIWNEIKRTRKYVIFNKESRMREKAAALLSYLGIDILKQVWNSKLAVKK